MFGFVNKSVEKQSAPSFLIRDLRLEKEQAIAREIERKQRENFVAKSTIDFIENALGVVGIREVSHNLPYKHYKVYLDKNDKIYVKVNNDNYLEIYLYNCDTVHFPTQLALFMGNLYKRPDYQIQIYINGDEED